MKAEVRKDGVLIPRRLLKKGVKKVEIRKEGSRIVVLPVANTKDPIWRLGKRPVKSGARNGSLLHDKYLYDPA